MAYLASSYTIFQVSPVDRLGWGYGEAGWGLLNTVQSVIVPIPISGSNNYNVRPVFKV